MPWPWLCAGVAMGRHSRQPDTVDSPMPLHGSRSYTETTISDRGRVVAHLKTSYLLDCPGDGHRVTCGCGHFTGERAYCWVCGEWRTVTAKEVTQYDTRAKAMEGAFSDKPR